jgi:DNA polymerase
LDDACAALTLNIRKDPAGHKVMMKMNKPRKPRKAERLAGTTGLLWWETIPLLNQLFEYCKQDVRAECALSAALPDLTKKESELYTLDQEINERGFQLDRHAIHTALHLIAQESVRLNGELATLTGGQVKKATQRAQLLKWLNTQGLFLNNTQAATIDAYLSPQSRNPLPGASRRALEILRALGKSSTAKYQAMSDWICPDDRVHGGLLYHGASTGRWTGQGCQPHNFPKGTLKGVTMEDVWTYLQAL